jgi:malonate transporter
MAVNPMPWSIVLGALSSAFGLTPIGPVGARWACWPTPRRRWRCSPSAPCWRARSSSRGAGARAACRLADFVPVALAKLVVHPLLVLWVGIGLAIAAGLPLDRSALTIMVLVAALPSASNVSLLAERFGADNGRIARIILDCLTTRSLV